MDVSLGAADRENPGNEQNEADLKRAESILRSRPDDTSARLNRAIALIRKGGHKEAIVDMDALLKKNADDLSAARLRIIALARLGRKEETYAALGAFRRYYMPESAKLVLTAAVAAELGDVYESAIQTLESALKAEPDLRELRYVTACGEALVSRRLCRSKNPSQSGSRLDRSTCSGRLSSVARPNSAVSKTISISTRFVTTPGSPSSGRPATPSADTRPCGRAIRRARPLQFPGSIRKRSSVERAN